MSFSARLKEQRERMGLTQIQLATALGITKGAVGNYETGASSPKAEVLYKLFDILHCDANFLFQDEMAALHEANASPQEMECLVKKYRLLDPYGKEAVDGVLDVETRRCEAEREKQTAILVEQREQTEAAAEIAPEVYFITPGFLATMSAGTGQPADDEYPKNYRLKKEPPRGTSDIAPVSGDSMEPTYHDGDKLFIRACTEIRPGQVGVFYMDGQQWVKELGDGLLISHNPKYPPRPITEDVQCQGLVLGVCDEGYFE